MKVAFYDPVTGIFTGALFDGPAFAVAANTPSGLAAWPYADAAPQPALTRIEDGAPVAYSPAAVGFTGLLAGRLRDVSAAADARHFAAIACAGASWDADELSRARIAGMLSRIARGSGLPAGWLGWRDCDNSMHWEEDDAATVAQHLTAVAEAIEDREQAVLAVAWQHKDALRGLAASGTVADLLAYDIGLGWPPT